MRFAVSLRRWGDTQLFADCVPMDRIQHLGRWAQMRTELHQMEHALPFLMQRRVAAFNAVLPLVWNLVDI